jgi:hypothetical protein
MRSTGSLVSTALVLVVGTTAAAAGVQVEATEGGAKITIDGKPFAEYVALHGHQPIIWPIIGPGGQAMTRQYPMGDALEGEERDHPHHRSLWFNHGIVNGHDFWLEPRRNGEQNVIAQRDLTVDFEGKAAKIVTRNDWKSGDEKICEDLRTIWFGADVHGRWIDYAIEVTASEGDVTFGDTKEGAFGLRVPGTMSVDAEKGGRIRNSRGQKDAVAWAKPAEWVDYSGPVDGKPAGIVVFEMPDSFRHPTRWHVRTYGLFAANPFGQRDFEADNQGPATLKKGEKLRLHYRVLFYDGEMSDGQLASIYKEYGGK